MIKPALPNCDFSLIKTRRQDSGSAPISIKLNVVDDNTYYHSDTCNLPDLDGLFRGKTHLEGLLNERKWGRVKARIKRLDRAKGLIR